MPITPPDSFDTYLDSTRVSSRFHASQSLGGSTQTISYDLSGCEGRDLGPQYPRYTLPPLSQPVYGHDNNRPIIPSYRTTTQGPLKTYGTASIPLLPPLRIPDRVSEDYEHHVQLKRVPTVPPTKEEKLMGGVAAKLDYEMEDMVDFVSEMAQGMYNIYASKICLADIDMTRSIVNSKSVIHPDFRKYVSQILSSTRLPSSTIVLGLHYMAKRMTLLSATGNYTYGGGRVFHMLTTALLLGSKFLDDNTFQNRSWSEVSNIPVGELDILELEWLVAIDWNMHIDPNDPEGFYSWRNRWVNWSETKKTDLSLAESLRQTRLDVDVLVHGGTSQRQQSIHQHTPLKRYPLPSLASYRNNVYNDRSQSQWPTPRYDYWPPPRSQTNYSPPSAPETGPTTPEWYGIYDSFGHSQASQQTYPTAKVSAQLQILEPNAPQSGYHTPYAPHCYSCGHSNQYSCNCCVPNHDRYVLGLGHEPQSVAG